MEVVQISKHNWPTSRDLAGYVSRINYLIPIAVTQHNELKQKQRDRFWQAPAIVHMFGWAFKPYATACYLPLAADVTTLEDAKVALTNGSAFPMVTEIDMRQLNNSLARDMYAAYRDDYLNDFAQRLLRR